MPCVCPTVLLRRVHRTGRDAATLPGSGDGHRAGSQSGLPGRGPWPVVPRPTRPPAPLPAAAPAPLGGTGSRVSAALRGRGLLSFKSLSERSDAKFCCGFSLPASPPPPPRVHLPDAGLSRHRRRVPPGAGREGGPAPKAPGLARPHFPGARAAAPAPLRPGGRRTTPPGPGPGGCLPRTTSHCQPAR